MNMLPRERVYAALAGEPVDRVPHNFRAWGNVCDLVQLELGLADHDAVHEWALDDIREIGGYDGFCRSEPSPGEDIWGVRRETATSSDGSYSHIVYSPLAAASSMDEVRAYRFPQADELYDLADFSAVVRETSRDGRYFLCLEVESLYDRSWNVRGMENFMVDLLANQEIARYILTENARFFFERTRLMLEAAPGQIDCVGMYDDFGTQQAMMISPDLYREFVKPFQKELIQLAHEHGAKVFYHSCGCVLELYADFLEIGVDIIDPLQFPALQITPEELRTRFPHANFHGGVDTQHLMPFGSPEEVRDEVRRLIDILGGKGHYILSTSHNLQGGVPCANISALVEAIRGG